MLVLGRKIHERVILDKAEEGGGNTRIIIEVTQIDGGQVRLGFIAPACVKIMREELLASDNRGEEAAY